MYLQEWGVLITDCQAAGQKLVIVKSFLRLQSSHLDELIYLFSYQYYVSLFCFWITYQLYWWKSEHIYKIRTPGQYPSTPKFLMQSFLLSVLENCYLKGLNLIFDWNRINTISFVKSQRMNRGWMWSWWWIDFHKFAQ